MRYYTDEERQKAAQSYIIERETLVLLFPALCNVVKGFNGKVYNKRLETAFRAATGEYIYCNKNNTYIYIEHRCNTLASVKISDLEDEKRINADVFIESLTEYKTRYEKEAEHMKAILPTIETRRQQIKIIREMIKATVGDLNYLEKEIFGLNYSLKNY